MDFKVANVITAFNSASGGPPRTVSAIARASRGHWRVELFTTDAVGPHPDNLLTYDFPGHVNMLPAARQRPIGGTLMAAGIFRAWRAQLIHGAAADVVHIHGLWNAYLVAYAKAALNFGIPYIVAPHGMLERWSLNEHAWRKKLALRSYQGYVLAHATAIHATSEMEAENLRMLPWIRSPIFVVPNPVDEPPPTTLPAAASDRRTLLFLSRIHPKKGLEILFQAWARIRPVNWDLLVVGQGDPAYLQHLQRISQGIPEIKFQAHVDGLAREHTFARAGAVVLPTYSENFGNVVAEALMRGKPVLTTTGTPWRILTELRAGWWVQPSPDALGTALQELISLNPEQLQNMGARGRAYAYQHLSIAAVRAALLNMYRSAIGARKPAQPPEDLRRVSAL